jgi:hypothetical protein
MTLRFSSSPGAPLSRLMAPPQLSIISYHQPAPIGYIIHIFLVYHQTLDTYIFLGLCSSDPQTVSVQQRRRPRHRRTGAPRWISTTTSIASRGDRTQRATSLGPPHQGRMRMNRKGTIVIPMASGG